MKINIFCSNIEKNGQSGDVPFFTDKGCREIAEQITVMIYQRNNKRAGTESGQGWVVWNMVYPNPGLKLTEVLVFLSV